MIKSFYKTKQYQKVFFDAKVKMRSYAVGRDVHLDFLDWRKHHLSRWNNDKVNYLLCEHGDIGANFAKISQIAEIRITEPKNQILIEKQKEEFSPLRFEGMYLEIGKNGDLYIDGQKSDIYFGTELKAWGATAIWKNNMPTYVLFVVGKNKLGEMGIYGYAFDGKNRPTDKIIVSRKLEPTLSRKSRLYCFGKHIFLVHGMQLHYYYYNEKLQRLEDVAIETDTDNQGKQCCSTVTGAVICDSKGFVHWKSGNKIYSFPIGYPKRLHCIDLGERVELDRIQCFDDKLFVYRRNKITHEYSCLKYVTNSYGEFDGQVFNTGSKYNLFYADKNGTLNYLKVPGLGTKAVVASHNMTTETVLGQLELKTENIFCINGNLYTNCTYVGQKFTT